MIAQRLKAVTQGAPTQEFTLRRNLVGQLGFHVQHDGLITEVENFGYAWQTGLRQGSRLVEICKHPATALTHDQMVELLKTSMTVTVAVIPPFPNGHPRKGCSMINCGYAYGALDPVDTGDYENFSASSSPDSNLMINKVSINSAGGQQPGITIRQMFDRPSSPPRSSNSSGYGTGSSRKSFANDPQRVVAANNNFLARKESSSGEEWYDFNGYQKSNESSPPPVPNRVIGSGTNSAFRAVVPNESSSNNSTTSSPSIFPTPVQKQRDYESSDDTLKSDNRPLNSRGPVVQNNNHVIAPPPGVFQEERRDAKVTYLRNLN